MARERTGSVAAQVALFQRGEGVVLPPEGIEMDDAELLVWHQFVKARAPDAWNDLDLSTLARAVKLEVRIRKLEDRLDGEDPVQMNDKGMESANPLVQIIDNCTRRQLSLLRMLGVAVTPQAAQNVNAQARAEAQKNAEMRQAYETGGMASLLARPN